MSRNQVPTVDLFERYYQECCNWSKWGADDELGTLNYITPEVVRYAATRVRSGKVISLQCPLDENGPQTGAFGRVNPIHQMVATGTDHVSRRQIYSSDPLGWGYADDSLFFYLQGGTQWDALGHIFRNGKMYNGFEASEVSASGAKKGSIASARTVVSRGVLLDVPRVLGKVALAPGEAILPEQLDAVCKSEGVEIRQGDVVIIRTGDMGARRNQPEWAGYSAGDAPGLSILAAPWLYEKKIAAVATDTWGVEVRPNELKGTFQPLHLIMLVSMGLFVGEIWDLDELAEDCSSDGQYDFLFAGPPLVIPGAVGSPLNPQAVK